MGTIILLLKWMFFIVIIINSILFLQKHLFPTFHFKNQCCRPCNSFCLNYGFQEFSKPRKLYAPVHHQVNEVTSWNLIFLWVKPGWYTLICSFIMHSLVMINSNHTHSLEKNVRKVRIKIYLVSLFLYQIFPQTFWCTLICRHTRNLQKMPLKMCVLEKLCIYLITFCTEIKLYFELNSYEFLNTLLDI